MRHNPAFQRQINRIITFLFLLVCSGCFIIPGKSSRPEIERPTSLLNYYSQGRTLTSFTTKVLANHSDFKKSQIDINTPKGVASVTYFDSPDTSSQLLLVYPLMGGSRIITEHFAEVFARNGFDCAIVKRNDDYKKPENFDKLESILRDTVIRDRVALDYFEKHEGKRVFGSFGISRGAINATMVAGVDKRLKYNVLVMGASDIPSVFRRSSIRKVRKYRDTVMKSHQYTPDEFFFSLQKNIITNPSRVTKYIRTQNTMLMLATFDTSVPFVDGLAMRKEIGYPKTIFIPANHYIGAALTQILSIKEPIRGHPIFPFDYIEGEAIAFFREKFRDVFREKRPLVALLKTPMTLIASFISQLDDNYGGDPQ
jgi:hypothetical protein